MVHEYLECGEVFKIAHYLKLHVNLRHKSGQKWEGYKCKFCGTFLASRKSLRNHHLIEHFDLMKYKCQYCEKSYSKRNSMKMHIVVTHKSGGLECEFCDRRFVYKNALSKHLLESHLDKPGPNLQIVECADCGKRQNYEKM